MTRIPTSIIIVIALLALFLISITVAKYAVRNNFIRTRFIMSALFVFIVATLTISFWDYAALTLPYSTPAFCIGIVLGYLIGVHTERQKLMMQGLERYMERFARIEKEDVQKMTWWSFVNFYSVMSGLILINLIGFTNVILSASAAFVIGTSVIGALLVGSIVPYLAHLWTVKLTNTGT